MKNVLLVFSLLFAFMACSKDETPSVPALDVNVKQIEVEAEGKTVDVSVSSNVSWSVSSSASDWCTVSPQSGSDNGSFQVKIEPNPTLSSRDAKITIKGEGLEKTINVEQEAASKEDLLSGSTWEMISQGSGDENYNDLVGTIIELKADKSTVATMNLEIEEGVFLDKIEGTWSISGDVISIEGEFIGMDAELTFEIKNMTEEVMKCVMNINLPLLPPDGIPVVLKRK